MNLISGYPYWLIKDGLPFQYPALRHAAKTDVLIIGGGISGALMAYHLVNAGINCVVVDGRTIGLGSTCASTALLQYEIDVPLYELQQKIGMQAAITAYKLCEASIFKLGDIAARIKYKDFSFKKSLYYAATNSHVQKLATEFAARKTAGFPVNLIGPDDIYKRFNFKAPKAILSDVGAQIDAYGFTHALHQHSTRKGCEVYDRTSIIKTTYGRAGVTCSTSTGVSIQAKKIIYANGYEAVNYIDKKIVELSSTYATVSEQCNDSIQFWEDDALIWNTAKPYLYMRTTGDRRIIVGGRDEKFGNAPQRDLLIDKKATALKKDFEKLFPRIEFKNEFNWTGVFGSTKDGLPYIGTWSKLPNTYFALGFGGNGITFSLVAAEMITELIRSGKSKQGRLFSFDR